jgi:hypothetical protein
MGHWKVDVRNQEPGSPKGIYGRHTALRDGDCIRGLVGRGESPTGKARNPTRTEGLQRNDISARL